MTLKRVIDFVGALTGIILVSPVLAATTVAIRVADGRPVLFRQERVGLNGTTFYIRKFRTMTTGGLGPNVSSSNDPRVTPLGSFLRKTKIDELPQLLDVLGGKMSIVGPRPEVPEFVNLWPSDEREIILSVRPGITDPASVQLRDESQLLAHADDAETFYVSTLLPWKVSKYVEYVQNRNTRLDIAIIAATMKAIMR